jgi:hypothetical protein
MPIFKIEIPGELWRNWPDDKEIKLLGCLFKPGNDTRDFWAQTEIEAPNEEVARQLGYEMCLDATNLLEFCLGEEVSLSTTKYKVSESVANFGTGIAEVSCSASTVLQIPPDEKQMEAIASAQQAIEREFEAEKKESLIRAIHWYARGCQEKRTLIDRFIKFWIALEVLVNGRGKKVTRKVKASLTLLYPSANKERIAEMVNSIYDTRGRIVHIGIRQPQDLHIKLDQLENILSDLLRAKLTLPFKACSGKFFT